MGRHSSDQTSSSSRARAGLALLLAGGVTAAAALAVPTLVGGTDRDSAQARGASSSPSASACPAPVELTAAPGTQAALGALSDAALGPGCATITVATGSSTATARWSATAGTSPATAWVGSSPVVLVGTAKQARSRGWERSAVSTEALRKAVGVSGIRLRSADPTRSDVALAGLTALAGTAYGGSLPSSIRYGAPEAADLGVIRLEHSLSPTVDEAAVLPEVTDAATFDKTVGFAVSTEASAAAFAAAHPQVSLVAAPIGPGAAVGLVIEAPEGASAAVRDAVTRIRELASGAAGGPILAAHGIRASTGGPAPTIPSSLTGSAGAAASAALPAQGAEGARAFWGAITTRISTLAVMDFSGSMVEALPGGEVAKIDILRKLAVDAYALASPRARSGLWGFTTVPGTAEPRVLKLAPLRVNMTRRDGTTHAQATVASFKKVAPRGGTPLYEAIRDAYSYAVDEYDPGFVNQILVVTDGADEDSTSTVDLKALKSFLSKTVNPKKPVRIIIVALNPKQNMSAMTAIARLTGGKAVSATTVSAVPRAVEEGLFTA